MADERVGDAVVGLLDIDVVIDMDRRLLPGGDHVAFIRQGAECGFVEFGKEIVPGLFHPGQDPLVQLLCLLRDGLVEFRKAEEGPVAQGGEDATLSLEHPVLRLRVVTGVGHPGGQDADAVMFRPGGKGLVEFGLVIARMGDGDPGIIQHNELRTAAEPLQTFGQGANEVPFFLIGHGEGEKIRACTEHGDEEVHLDERSGCRVLVVRLVSREVDKEPLSRLVG